MWDIYDHSVDDVKYRECSREAELEAIKDDKWFTLDTRKEILKAIDMGLPINKACEWAGISRARFDKWCDKGAVSEDDDDPYRLFYLQVKQLDATFEAKLYTYADPANNPNIAWQMLKNRYSEDWGDNNKKIEVSGSLASDIDIKDKKSRLHRIMHGDKE